MTTIPKPTESTQPTDEAEVSDESSSSPAIAA
ncbi:hypothetical protein SAMN02745830_05392 [Streptomyces sp. Amel2xC10]|nr:hypothetical protein SAMN02745830_05392 [Streptomyces sp. Amel2xC10]